MLFFRLSDAFIDTRVETVSRRSPGTRKQKGPFLLHLCYIKIPVAQINRSFLAIKSMEEIVSYVRGENGCEVELPVA